MENVCLHRGRPLGQGTIEGGKVVCPWHGWQWNPHTGEAAHNPNAKVAAVIVPIHVRHADDFAAAGKFLGAVFRRELGLSSGAW